MHGSVGVAFIGLVLVVVGLIQTVVPGLLWGINAFLSFRSPELLEPSGRRLHYLRLGGVVMLTLGVVAGSLAVLPEGNQINVRGAGTVAGLGALGIAVSAIRARLRAGETALQQNSGNKHQNWPAQAT